MKEIKQESNQDAVGSSDKFKDMYEEKARLQNLIKKETEMYEGAKNVLKSYGKKDNHAKVSTQNMIKSMEASLSVYQHQLDQINYDIHKKRNSNLDISENNGKSMNNSSNNMLLDSEGNKDDEKRKTNKTSPLLEQLTKQLNIELKVKEGIENMLNSNDGFEINVSSKLKSQLNSAITKIETLQAHILKEVKKLQEKNTDDVNSTDADTMLETTVNRLKRELFVEKGLMKGSQNLLLLLADEKNKKFFNEAAKKFEAAKMKNDILREILKLPRSSVLSPTKEKIIDEDLQAVSDSVNNDNDINVGLSGFLNIKVEGLYDIPKKSFSKPSEKQSSASHKTLKKSRKSKLTDSADSDRSNFQICVLLDRVPVSKSNWLTEGLNPGKYSLYLPLKRNKEIEINVYNKETRQICAIAIFSVIDFLDNEERNMKLILKPSGMITCKVLYCDPDSGHRPLKRQNRIFARGVDKKVPRPKDLNLNVAAWIRLALGGGGAQGRGLQNDILPAKNIAKPPKIEPDTKEKLEEEVHNEPIENQEETMVENDMTMIEVASVSRMKTNIADFKTSNFMRRESRLKNGKLTINNFNLRYVLGRGHFGKVILADYKKTKELFALKTLKKGDIIGREEFDSLVAERKVFEVANTSRHPFLVNMFACFNTESHICFVMEYVRAGDLMAHIHKRIFGIRRSKFYGASVLLGLKYLHDNKIVYRDLKLDNVLMGHDGYVKIADFGLCKDEMDVLTRTTTFCGTPEFLAPEILTDPSYTRAVDWWAFGVLLYEMILGESPFPGDDEEEIFDAIVNEDVCYPRRLDVITRNLLQSLMCKTPELRLGYAEQGAQAIMNHKFFKEIDFDALYKKEIVPEMIPTLKGSTDLTYFDQEFLAEKVDLTPAQSLTRKLTEEEQKLFSNFDFIASWA